MAGMCARASLPARSAPRATRLSAAACAVFFSLLVLFGATTTRADPDVVFLTTATAALVSDPNFLKTACVDMSWNASALISQATDSFAGLQAAMAAAAVPYAYVSATMDTSSSNAWLWRTGGDLSAFGGIVTAGKWAAGYPQNTSTMPYAVYSADLGALMNVNGTASYPAACMYDYYVAPEEVPAEQEESKKSKFPWWAILIIVLGSVVVIAVVVTVVLCCRGGCGCGKEEGDDVSGSSETRSRAGEHHSSSEEESDSVSSHSQRSNGDGSNRSFSTASAKQSRSRRAEGRTE
ncbi:hypothetical protein ABB37_08401 [Leptomonas pyrrhocoris]|uniref:C-type lectin domain-containing protein n=1 Tax=Leptomonas pyrrhocoris TaxID=157538 RepID=A0A0N0DSE7_LEPPY|nr:hypothetical protein ABB37_08401 [Leptomonas pyrrhocoris]KPA75504.1 hypothetical protein ABB37_08401 [Leptomonas pyrrhocoris]|eukprot:XP_015653943.1 hypothetical protein ABB37_08401 [Leptomonas pyrrhocoris]